MPAQATVTVDARHEPCRRWRRHYFPPTMMPQHVAHRSNARNAQPPRHATSRQPRPEWLFILRDEVRCWHDAAADERLYVIGAE